MKFKAVIFDLDGTLSDTLESIALAGNKMLKECGFDELPIDNYKYYAGDGADTLVKRALQAVGDKECENFEKAYGIYREFFKTDCTYHVKVFDGMPEALHAMKEQGMQLAVISNKPHEAAQNVVKELYGDVFDVVLGQRPGIPKKPDPMGARIVLDYFGVKPEECLYVGDTNVDMQTGKRAGMYTVGVLWGFRDRAELEENHADVIIEKPQELPGLLV